MKVAIIGAGVMGLSCAMECAQIEGVSVSLYHDPSSQSASRYAGGMLAPFSESDSLSNELQALAVTHSLPFWKELCDRFKTYFRETGTLVLAHPEDKTLLKRFEMHLPQGVYEYLDDVCGKEPTLSTRIQDGLWVYDESYLDTAQILKAMKDYIQNHHTLIEQHVNPENLNGFDAIIDCRGIGSDMKGLRAIKGERALIKCPDLNLQHCIRLMHPRYALYVVPHDEDIYMVGASMIEDNTSDKVSVRSALELLSAFSSLSPLALEAEILSIDAGFRPTFETHIPKVLRQGHIYRANGLYRHGFLLSPVMAKVIVSDIVKDEVKPEFNILFQEEKELHETHH